MEYKCERYPEIMAAWGRNVGSAAEPVNITELMDGINCKYDFRNVKPCPVLGEPLESHELCHEVTTGNILHNQIQVQGVLKRVIQPNNPRILFVKVIELCQSIAFLLDMLDLKGTTPGVRRHEKLGAPGNIPSEFLRT
jgi:hypothetical protein